MKEKILIKAEAGSAAPICLCSGLIPAVITVLIGISIYDPQYYFGTILFAAIVIGFIVGCITYFWVSKTELTVSDKRVYGCAAFGKRVDLPLDSISAVGTSWLNGIDVSTSSGTIKFKLVSNYAEIHSLVSGLLVERQNQSKQTTQTTKQSSTGELKELKELLDNGIITQEEFDAKKKQILGL